MLEHWPENNETADFEAEAALGDAAVGEPPEIGSDQVVEQDDYHSAHTDEALEERLDSPPSHKPGCVSGLPFS